MHAYRTHTCGALRAGDVGADVRLSGWVHRVRDHGGLLFIDLRDHYGLTQIVADPDSPAFKTAERVRSEWCIRVDGEVRHRPAETVNPNLPTGEIEVFARRDRGAVGGAGAAAAGVRRARLSGGHAAQVPLPRPPPRVAARNIMRRVAIVAKMRELMRAAGFNEFQTPILTASSPEGARDFLVPSRLHPGKVLRAAAGAAAVQAADHDGGLRPLLPDRALLPRRGPARRPAARRILPARRRDELRHAGRRLRGDGAGDPRRLRGFRRRQGGDAASSRASPTARRCATTAPTSRISATRSRCRR